MEHFFQFKEKLELTFTQHLRNDKTNFLTLLLTSTFNINHIKQSKKHKLETIITQMASNKILTENSLWYAMKFKSLGFIL